MDLRRVVIRLRMVAVDFGDAARLDVLREEAPAVADGEAQVVQAALVAAPGGVADDDGQHVDAEVVVVGAPDGTLEEEAAVAAAEVEDERGRCGRRGACQSRRPSAGSFLRAVCVHCDGSRISPAMGTPNSRSI